MKMIAKSLFVRFILINILFCSGIAFADDEQAKLLKDLADKKALLEAQKDLIVSQKALIDAKYPTLTGGKEGTISQSNDISDSFSATAETYNALNQASDDVCEALGKIEEHKILLINENDSLSKIQYDVINTRLIALNKNFEELMKINVLTISDGFIVNNLPPIVTATAVINSITNFSKLFRKDIVFSSLDISDTTNAWDSAIAKCSIKSSKISVINSANLDGIILSLPEHNILQEIIDLTVNKPKVTLKLAEVDTAMSDTKKTKLTKEELENLKLLLNSINTEIDNLVNILSITEDNKPKLLTLVKGEFISNKIKTESISAIAVTKVLKATGHNMKTSSIWTSDKLYASGSVAVMYSIVQNCKDKKDYCEGKILGSGVIVVDTDLKQIQKLP